MAKKKMPCTQLTLEYLRKQGMIADVVEHRIPNPMGWGKTKDLFNIFDIVAINRNVRGNLGLNELWLVQTTSASNRASRRKKMLSEVETMYALGDIPSVKAMLICWGKKPSGRYECSVECTRADYAGGGDDGDRILFLKVPAPTMQGVRDRWREKNPDSRQEREKGARAGRSSKKRVAQMSEEG